ncbi:MAG: hypothetical protein KA469_02695 [Phycisphaerae bacterium]|nr:hypothetical protein [Phycisphaerae bacterium]
MKKTILTRFNRTPAAADRELLKDYSILQGVPLRSSCPVGSGNRREEWAAVFNELRVPFLLLGVVGALGLLAHYRPDFAKTISIAYWPSWGLSIVFLSLAGFVTAVLTADWISVRLRKRAQSRKRRLERYCRPWRGR